MKLLTDVVNGKGNTYSIYETKIMQRCILSIIIHFCIFYLSVPIATG